MNHEAHSCSSARNERSLIQVPSRPPVAMWEDDGRRGVLWSHVDSCYYEWRRHSSNPPSHPMQPLAIPHPQSHGGSSVVQVGGPRAMHPPEPMNRYIYPSLPYSMTQEGPRVRYSPYPVPPDAVHVSRSRMVQVHPHHTMHGYVDQRKMRIMRPISVPHAIPENCGTDMMNEKENHGGDKKGGSETLCVVCLDAKKSILFFPCFHMSCCRTCAYNPALHKCPICRAEIRGKNRVFW